MARLEGVTMATAKKAKEFRMKTKKLYNKEVELISSIDYGYTRPFVLTDILQSRFRKQKLYEVLE